MTAQPRLPLGPGPSPVHPRVLQALSRPTLGHLDPDFLQILDEVGDLLREVFRTENLAFAVSGSGSAGMEAAMVNLLERGDTAVVGVAGFFAERMGEMARRTGADLVRVEAPWGRPVATEDLEAALKRHPQTKVLAIVHAETSTGVRQPLEEVAAMCQERDVLFVVDTVASLGGLPVDVDRLGIDICFAGSQKCLSVPPGLAPISYSAKALAAVESRKTPVQSWYLDVMGVRQYVGSADRRYHHTAPVNMIYGLLEGLKMVLEEGLEARWQRHEKVGRAFQERIQKLGFELFAPQEYRLPQVTSLLIPEGVDDAGARKRLIEEHGIEIAGGLGEYRGRMWRVGLMGEGAKMENVDRLLDAITAVI
jgi:alanine-glyoxylate transaminase/serine-glyoxylate transaminase/serine-pyruvate transaminase